MHTERNRGVIEYTGVADYVDKSRIRLKGLKLKEAAEVTVEVVGHLDTATVKLALGFCFRPSTLGSRYELETRIDPGVIVSDRNVDIASFLRRANSRLDRLVPDLFAYVLRTEAEITMVRAGIRVTATLTFRGYQESVEIDFAKIEKFFDFVETATA